MTSIRERQEALEESVLSPYGTRSARSLGRDREEEPCPIRTDFQRDRDRIIYSKAFRRLKHKTQVFISPEGDHYRTRLTHTLEVSQIARTIARALRLNEDLTEAVALGHDLGHTPFGHAGERVLDQVCSFPFRHNEHSLRVVEILEGAEGRGLNLTREVRDGILNHVWSGRACTPEGRIVRFADRIAYINHDIEDAIRGRILTAEDIPTEYRTILGDTSSARINRMITDIIRHSGDSPDMAMSPDIAGAMDGLHRFMFERVYIDSSAKAEENKAMFMVEKLFERFMERPETLPDEDRALIGDRPLERVVCDFVAGMTDRYAVREFQRQFVPASWGF